MCQVGKITLEPGQNIFIPDSVPDDVRHVSLWHLASMSDSAPLIAASNQSCFVAVRSKLLSPDAFSFTFYFCECEPVLMQLV